MHAKVCSGINGGDKRMRDERAVERERCSTMLLLSEVLNQKKILT